MKTPSPTDLDQDTCADQVRGLLEREHGKLPRGISRHRDEIENEIFSYWMWGGDPIELAELLARKFKETV